MMVVRCGMMWNVNAGMPECWNALGMPAKAWMECWNAGMLELQSRQSGNVANLKEKIINDDCAWI